MTADVIAEDVGVDEDLESTLGATRSGLNALVIGTVYRLMTTRVVQRTDLAHQSESRLAEEVSIGDLATLTDKLRVVRDRARADAASQLRSAYPWRLL